ncbi:hypothetical protein BGX24_006423 [Mortierella sp. AD032]|nr:hypothetical protein BGX24_006423 [Mortierella sp. AD032]
MSSSFPLPLECLQLIIHQLKIQYAQKSLASLLCVNKYVCAATLPIPYGDPFNMPSLISAFGGFNKNNQILLGVRKINPGAPSQSAASQYPTGSR